MKNLIAAPRLSEPLNRQTLSAQVAALMRSAIQQRTWIDYLPSERRLCEYFEVSRPTVRSALQGLAREGLVEIHHGRRNRILGRTAKESVRQNRFVGIVTQVLASQSSATSQQVITEFRAALALKGFATEIFICPPRIKRGGFRLLENFVRQNRAACCVLVSVSEEVQLWFARHGVPALVLGSCHKAVRLPSLDVDYRSVCRHAAGIFLGKGHRHLALVVKHSGLAGDLASEEGFNEAVKSHAGADVRAKIIRHQGNAQSITACLEPLFESAHPPTALLVAQPRDVFAVIIYLLRCGRAVPDAVSLIARDQDHLFDAVTPAVAHYRFDGSAYMERLTRLASKLMSTGYLSPQPTLFTPKFFAGGTVKPRKLAAL